MRICIRCQSEMVEDYGLKIESFSAGVAPVKLSRGQGVLSESVGNIKLAICPNCGEISLYIEDYKDIVKLSK
ncbi:MAG: hypothetical protein RR537_05680 [Longicatena sp.]